MFGAGPTTSHPSSPSKSTVNGATTGESSTTRMRRPVRSAAAGRSCSSSSVDESRNDIAVRTRHFHLRSRIEHQEAFAVGVRLHLADEVEVDDGRTVDALKAARIEPLFQILHRLAQDQRVVARLDAHVVARRVDALDGIAVDAENL